MLLFYSAKVINHIFAQPTANTRRRYSSDVGVKRAAVVSLGSRPKFKPFSVYVFQQGCGSGKKVYVVERLHFLDTFQPTCRASGFRVRFEMVRDEIFENWVIVEIYLKQSNRGKF